MKKVTMIQPKRKETRKTSGWLINSISQGETSYSKVLHWPGHPMSILLMPAYCFSCFFPFWSNHSDLFHWKCFCILFRHFLFLCLHKSLHQFCTGTRWVREQSQQLPSVERLSCMVHDTGQWLMSNYAICAGKLWHRAD